MRVGVNNKECPQTFSYDTIVVHRDRKSRPKMYYKTTNNFFSTSSGKQVLALPLALHTSPYHAAAVTKSG